MSDPHVASPPIPSRRVSRPPHLAPKVVFVDGMLGCGKTMLSPIVGSLPRVELLQYLYELEYTCALDSLSLIDRSASVMLIRMLTDLRLYNLMMSRDINFRRGDLSSVFMNARKWRYLLRLVRNGNEHVLPRIEAERPILHVATHHLLAFAAPIVEGLGSRGVIVEVIRHPLYMIRQQALNMGRYGEDVRDFTVWHSEGTGAPVPYFAAGWEERFREANSWERAILFMDNWKRQCEEFRRANAEWWDRQVIIVPFETYVLDPAPYMSRIERALATTADRATYKMMRKQRVPRNRIAAGLPLPIYRQYGWRPPLKGATELDELNDRRADAAAQVSRKMLDLLDELSRQYEAEYLAGVPAFRRGGA